MRAWIATALGAAALIAGTAADAQHRCVPTDSRPCLTTGKAVDFNSVPDIAKQIVNEEPISAPQKNPLFQPVPAAPYTGPIFGATTTSGKRTPTVAHWPLNTYRNRDASKLSRSALERLATAEAMTQADYAAAIANGD